MSKPRLTVGLLSHYFDDPNLGCVALSVSNVRLLEVAADRAGVDLSYVHLINEKTSSKNPPSVPGGWRVGRIPSSSAVAKLPWRLVSTKALDSCDLVMNINAGDGFTDIYGLPRLMSETYMSIKAISRRIPLVLAPQTIGPFGSGVAKRLARVVLRRSMVVFARDEQSAAVARSLGAPTSCREVIDVAFALPFHAAEAKDSCDRKTVAVGVNISGLLWRGGYDRANYFGLSFDYREFVLALIRKLLDKDVEVHLIGHVFSTSGIEDDYSACEEAAVLCPGTVPAPRFQSPEDAKSYIAALDGFTGARMHATIAALSAGVPVVPIGYSDKVKGLYRTLGYDYFLDARGDWTAETASDMTIRWLEQRTELRQAVEGSRAVWSSALEVYVESLARLLAEQVDTSPRSS